MQAHLDHLVASVDHIKKVVATQQAYAGSSLLTEQVAPGELVEDALRIANASSPGGSIDVVRDIANTPPVQLDKTRALQILVNLVDNARQAMAAPRIAKRKLTVRVDAENSRLRFRVTDSGCGIESADLARIFSHGFTTRAGGHGFGLHSCALAAREMGGNLTAHSDGPETGATFTLDLPFVPAVRP
ncbi:sensor histidine kinase [Ramlibacter sp.]|uniref:sensor histidine kinase n=1 Tax=Ramlibacter sp. TaxID=1917967 RepID=UPI003D1022CB